MTVFSAKDIAGGYAAAEDIVKGISLDVAAGEIVAIIGPNGAGKSTFLKLVAGLLRARRGEVTVTGVRLDNGNPQSVAARGVVFVPQERNIFGALTIAENLELGCFVDPPAAKRRAETVYARFPILAQRKRAAGRSLSGGQRQMLAMGIALMADPKVLLLDEPSAGLSPAAAAEMFGYVRALAREGIAVAMVEQNALEALAMSDRASVFVDGLAVAAGAARAIADDPDIRRMFLGGRKRD
jgi:branched-chain amino acid transport system ATP-binding protein